MGPVTLSSARWPFVVMALLAVLPLLGPFSFPLFMGLRHVRGWPDLRCEGFAVLASLCAIAWIGWFCLLVVPVLRPRRLVLNEGGITLDTMWRRQHWNWAEIVGVWPLGGYKPQLEISTGRGKPRRVFLGPYWPGDTAKVSSIVAAYRAGLEARGIGIRRDLPDA